MSPLKKTTLKRRRSAVGILLSGLGRIAADLHSYGTLPDEPLKLLRMPDTLPTSPFYRVSDSVVPPASQVQVNCSFILEIIFTPMILGKQMQGRGPRGSTSCSKTLATLSQPIFCTSEIFRLSAMLVFNLTPRSTALITSIYCRTCKLLPPE